MLREPDYTIPGKNIDPLEESKKTSEWLNLQVEKMIRSSVEDLIKYTPGEAIHLEGELTEEYLTMLAMYALYRERTHPAAKVILDNIGSYEMSDGLIQKLMETVEKYRK